MDRDQFLTGVHSLALPELPTLAPQAACVQVLLDKYAHPGEHSASDVIARVARALGRDSTQAARFEAAMQAGFIPGGRILSAAGTGWHATLANCFVQPLGDFLCGERDGTPGILRALEQAAETMQMGGGVGYDFSPIRPQGARINGNGSRACGPLGFMRVFDTLCSTIESAGARRGAQMGVLRCDHPDIESFIRAKRLPGELTHFNLSVAVTDALMQALSNETELELVHPIEPGGIDHGCRQRSDGQWVYRTVKARALWDGIVRAAHASGEPGILFVDTINRLNNLSDIEQLTATNPCGEQPLPPWGACVLGSVDLTRLVQRPFTAQAAIDWPRLKRLVHDGVALLDRALDVGRWPLPQQAEEVRAKRRIGLGFLGLADALILLGHRYDSARGRELAADIARFMCHEAYAASVELARTLGAFPSFDPDRLLEAPRFASTLPLPLKSLIARHGLRHSHLMSIAPTGSIALAFADNASSGIEPVFAASSVRMRQMPDRSRRPLHLVDHAVRLWQTVHPERLSGRLPPAFISATQMRARDHLSMVAAVAPFIDAGISKTVNLGRGASVSDTADVFREAWQSGLKGITVFRADVPGPRVLSTPSGRSAPITRECGQRL